MTRTALLALLLVLAVQDDSVRAGQNKVQTATIRGRVTVALTGEPIRGATVQASASERETGVMLRATTDVQGRFEIPDVSPGQYRVRASRTGFVSRQLGQLGPFESVDPIAVRPGQVITADFPLARGAAISGLVFDDQGDPVAEARVNVMRVQIVQGRRRLVPVGSTPVTDDRGVYRVYGLPPGEYFVSATIGRETLTVASSGSSTLFVNGVIAGSAGSGSTSAFAPTYYPGTARAGDAHRVTVRLAEDVINVNFSLVPARLVRVSGRVFNQSGEPVQARVELVPDIEGQRTNAHSTTTADDGSVAINGVPPGTYHVGVLGRITADNPPEVAWVPIDVGAGDASELIVVTSHGATVAGTVKPEGTSRTSMAAIRIVAQPSSVRAGSGDIVAPVVADGFELEGLLGPYTIGVDRLPPGWVVKSITVAGTDVTDGMVDFRGSEYLDVQVLLTNRLAELYGTVRTNGRAAARAQVLVFPDDASRWTGTSRGIRTARADQNGGFAVRGLLPNRRYLAVAVDYLNDGEEQDPEFLQRMKPRGTVVAVTSDQNRTQDLTLVTR